jgi:hypothetical protein
MGKPGHRRPRASYPGRFHPTHLHRHTFVARHVLDRSGRLATEEVAEIVAQAARLIGASPTLHWREREIMAHSRPPWPR